ncbi:efflux RND transporter permease subunit [Larkinella humicola]|uniref:Efflux RND transporter permease subunit n=1 Tax=Larkinella humicola TaxID=2607654 RepID=A0A5N1J8H5_9BACT|nr:efflux RND transporter permease subunit [Larkinella humicola]KAA9341120.1 efflux RND transporter permease subunit [Larkinella humicola]
MANPKHRIGHTKELKEQDRIDIIEKSSRTIGRAVFSSILVTLISFSPILFLTGQEKKLFSPLVLTKTFTMGGSAVVTLLIIPMLLRIFLKGRLIPESRNPVSNFFIHLASPAVHLGLKWKKTTLALVLLTLLGSIPILINTGSEFMPPLDEGSLLLMPVALPDVSNSEAKRIVQVQDRIIKSFPEVENILGKAGRASTATDNSPISMIESIIILKPRDQWREGMTKEKLIQEMNNKIRIPGVSVGWTQPIINRINMLSTGIRTDVGIKVYGQRLDSIYALSLQIEKVIKGVEGLQDLYVEQLMGGKYLELAMKRKEIARYGLDEEDVGMIIETALGGANLTSTVEGRRRFNVNLRLGQDYRNDIAEIKRIPILTEQYGTIPLSSVVDIRVTEGPPMINSENALLRGTVLFNVRGRDMGSVVKEAKLRVEEQFKRLPQGYFIQWSGQYENQVRAQQRLTFIIPIVLLIITLVLYLTFKSLREVLIVLSSVPIALMGGVYSLHFFQVNFSVAVAVGFIALFGVAVETGVLILVYMNQSLGNLVRQKGQRQETISETDIENAIFAGAVLRIRPVLMTVVVDMIGLFPVLISTGVGSDIMKPITYPYVFGLVTATIYALIILPVVFSLVKIWEFRRQGRLSFLTVEN